MIVKAKRLGLIALLLLGLSNCVSQANMFDWQMRFSKKNKQPPTKEVWTNVRYVAIEVGCTATCFKENSCLFFNKVKHELSDFDLGLILSQELQNHLTRDGMFEVVNYDPNDKKIGMYILVGLQVGLSGRKPAIDLLADYYLLKPGVAAAVAMQGKDTKLEENVYSLYGNEAIKRMKYGNFRYYKEMYKITAAETQAMGCTQIPTGSVGGVNRVTSRQNTKEAWLQNNGQELRGEFKRLVVSLARNLADSMLLSVKTVN